MYKLNTAIYSNRLIELLLKFVNRLSLWDQTKRLLLGDLIVEQTQEVVGLLFHGIHGSIGVYRFALTILTLGQ